MGKKSKKKSPSARNGNTSPPTTRGSKTLPRDIILQNKSCALCKTELKPTNWTEKEFNVLACCGSCLCMPCFESYEESSDQAGKRFRGILLDGVEKIKEEELETPPAVDIPELLEVYFHMNHPCRVCNTQLPKTEGEHISRMERLASAGHPEALYCLACHYAKGNHGVKLDDDKANEYFLAAAEKGHAGAQAAMGDRYHQGRGVPESFAEAKRLYEAASYEQGHAIAQNGLGHLYRDGKGVPEDRGKALALFKLSAEQEYPPGVLDYGVELHELGREEEAYKWFLKGAKDERYLKGYSGPIAQCQQYVVQHLAKTQGLRNTLPTAYFWAKRSAKNGRVEGAEMVTKFEELIWMSCAKCGAPEPTMRCSGCKAAAYCDNGVCQKLHWKDGGHKKFCRAVPKESDIDTGIGDLKSKYSKEYCSYCGKKDPTLLCGRCMAACYCRESCQMYHWKEGGHKGECKKAS